MTESTAAIEAIETDKDTWIYTFGSQQLQYNRTLGYECQQKYLDERIKLEYPGFVIANARVKRVDYPTEYAVRQSLQYDNAYVGERIYPHGDFITIDDYLGKHQLIKPVRKPWYATIISAVTSNNFITIILTICTSIIVSMLLDIYDATH